MNEIDGRRVRGDASRRIVLASAADLASVDGLDGLSIGRLATAANVSKSGVATLFGTKERLQLATVEAAAQRFREAVMFPARVEPRGIRRIALLLDLWIAYSRDRVFPGGCFFAAAAADLDAKPGPVHDAVALAFDSWGDYVRVSLGYAIETGELAAGTDAAQLSFEITALLDGANTRSLLAGSNEPYVRARRALVSRLLARGRRPRGDPACSPRATTWPDGRRRRRPSAAVAVGAIAAGGTAPPSGLEHERERRVAARHDRLAAGQARGIRDEHGVAQRGRAPRRARRGAAAHPSPVARRSRRRCGPTRSRGCTDAPTRGSPAAAPPRGARRTGRCPRGPPSRPRPARAS